MRQTKKSYRLFSLFVAVALLFTIFALQTFVQAEEQVKVVLDGQEQAYEQGAILKDGKVMMPFRKLFEAFGATIGWNSATKTATAEKEGLSVSVTMGLKKATLNGSQIDMGKEMTVTAGVSRVSMEFAAQALNLNARWDSAQKTVFLSTDMPIKIMLNGVELPQVQGAIVRDGKPMIPFRMLFETLGGTVGWVNETRTATAEIPNMKVEVALGSSIATVNGSQLDMGTAAILLNGSTVIPAEFVISVAGTGIQWDEFTKTITVTTVQEPVSDDYRNVALNRPVTSSGYLSGESSWVTDGLIDPFSFYDVNEGAQWLQIDLGKEYVLDSVRLFHFIKGSKIRTYKDVVVLLSNDATFASNITTVYNNDGDNSLGLGTGTEVEYPENVADGKRITFSPIKARYVRLWSNGSYTNAGNHYTEAEVYGNLSGVKEEATPTPEPTSVPTPEPTATLTPEPTVTPTPMPTIAAASQVVSIAVSEDGVVDQKSPDTAYPSDAEISMYSSSTRIREGFLKFDVSGITGTVSSAKLKLYYTSASTTVLGQSTLYGVGNTAISLGTITYNSRPIDTTAIATFDTPTTCPSWVEVDVTSYIKANGTVIFRLVNNATAAAKIASKEYADVTKQPVLDVTFN